MQEAQGIRLVTLARMKVASARGFGASPEPIAWEKVLKWAEDNSISTEQGKARFFGFNDPNPSAGSPNYGYEQWMTVPQDVKGSGDVQVKEFAGGSYAVTRCTLADIGESWQSLVASVEQSSYEIGNGQCLEECLSPAPAEFPNAVFDLYLPVKK